MSWSPRTVKTSTPASDSARLTMTVVSSRSSGASSSKRDCVLAELQLRQTAEAQCVESGGGRFRRGDAAAQDHPVDARRFARERLQLEFDRGLAGGRQRDLMAGLLRVGVGRADCELGSGVVGGGLDRDLFETGLGREQLAVPGRRRDSVSLPQSAGPPVWAVPRSSPSPGRAACARRPRRRARIGAVRRRWQADGQRPVARRLQGDQPVLCPAALIDGQH